MLALKIHRRDGLNYIYVAVAEVDKRTDQLRYVGGGTRDIRWQGVLKHLRSLNGVEQVIDSLNGKMKRQPFWRAPVEMHDQVLKALQKPVGYESEEMARNRLIEIVHPQVLEMFTKRSAATVSLAVIRQRIGPELCDIMFPYQLDGVYHIVNLGGSGIIADEMGLGKTMQGIGFLAYYNNELPVVILCPAAVKSSWRYHVRTYLKRECTVIETWTDDFDPRGINIMSYGMFASGKFADKIKAFKPKVVIVDESHYVKHATSERTKKTFLWCRQASRVLLLTGTPMNRTVELYTQIKCVQPRLFGKFFHYRRERSMSGVVTTRSEPGDLYYACRYCRPSSAVKRGRFMFEFSGAENMGELHAILKQHVMIRRVKDKVLTELPPKYREKIVLDEWVQEEPLEFNSETEFMALVRKTAEKKLGVVRSYLRDILIPELQNDPTLKVILWGHHHFMLDGMAEIMEAYKPLQMDGRTSLAKRTDGVQRFQRDPNVRVAILGITAMGTGVTMTAARISIFAELLFKPDDHLQAECRAHRIGQEFITVVRYLICHGSTDMLVMSILDSKMKTSGATVDGKECYLSGKVKRTAEILEQQTIKRRQLDDDDDDIDFSSF